MRAPNKKMALNWNWNNKIGELEIESYGKKHVINIYKGNALAIFINEWTSDDGVEKYTMYNFFCDKEHFKNCAKDKTWNYAEDWRKIRMFEVPSDFWVILKDLVKRGVQVEIIPKGD